MNASALRVGLVVPRFAPFRGGVETYVASASAALAAAGTDVTVITQAPRAAGLPRDELRDGYTVERHYLPAADIFDIPSWSAARAAARAHSFDVVWVHGYHTPLAWLAAEQARVPVVCTPHYHGVGHTPLRQALHRAYRPAGRRLMAASSRLIVDTDAEADLLRRNFPTEVPPEKIAVVPPVPTDPTRGLRPCAVEPEVVLTVARQEPYKRTRVIVRAIAELRERRVPARLVVVGDGSALADCRQLAAQLRAADVVTFTGEVDDETLARWWASASIYATASTQEAYGIGLADALVAGLPVVGSEIPAHREVVRRAGPRVAARLCCIDVPEVEAATRYADAIAELLSAAGSRQERAARCALPGAAEVVDQLLETFTVVSERARS